MTLCFMAYCPHPPILIPEIGGERQRQVEQTSAAMEKLADALAQASIDTLLCITPHGPAFEDAVAIWRTPELKGNLRRFGLNHDYCWSNDLELGLEIIKKADGAGILVAQLNQSLAHSMDIDLQLDHGVLVPLHLLQTSLPKNAKLLPVSIGFLSYEELYQFGMCIAQAVAESGKRVGVVISGDLSHKLSSDAPGGYHPRAAEFDKKLIELLEAEAVSQLLKLDSQLIKEAGECGFRPLIIGLGILDQHQFQAHTLSYQAPFGVGYLVSQFRIGQERAEGRYLDIKAEKEQEMQRLKGRESLPVRLARSTVEQLVGGGKVTTTPQELPGFHQRAGVFVSIKKNGQLRGCMGTVEPVRKNVSEEIMTNAISAAFNDPRFSPITAQELDSLTYSVDVLEQAEPIEDLGELNPQVYGVIVEAKGKRGLLLPNLPGIATAERQVAIAKEKAGIGPDDLVQLMRFKVTRYY